MSLPRQFEERQNSSLSELLGTNHVPDNRHAHRHHPLRQLRRLRPRPRRFRDQPRRNRSSLRRSGVNFTNS